MSVATDLLQELCGSDQQYGGTESSPAGRIIAVAWARVSTDMQEERGLSLPAQLAQIHAFADREEIEIIAEFSEAVSAFGKEEKRTEFLRMLQYVRTNRQVKAILIHDFSRFSRRSDRASTLLQELSDAGIRVISVTEGELEAETVMGVWKRAITLAKNEAYSREVAFHTRKGCRANVQTRDAETGWCYKNGGQPLFGYKAVQLKRGEERKGHPIIKSIWELDDTIVNGRPMHEWARECLLMAMQGTSLDQLRDFCNNNGVPARRKVYWCTTTWHEILQPHVLLKYTGCETWNVHRKNGSIRPQEEWVVVENAHPALLTSDEAKAIVQARQVNSRKGFDNRSRNSRSSGNLLAGGLFKCGRCGSNMVGMDNGKGQYYRCGSHAYRRGLGCGQGIYIPRTAVEAEVINGLQELIRDCSDSKGFATIINRNLFAQWQASSGHDPRAAKKLADIDRKIANLRQAMEDGFDSKEDLLWAKTRLQQLNGEREQLQQQASAIDDIPHLDTGEAAKLRLALEKAFAQGTNATKKLLLRECVESVTLFPDEPVVDIHYSLPAAVLSTNAGIFADPGVSSNTGSSGGGRLGGREH